MPLFTHDCDKCQPLMSLAGHDLYICDASIVPGMGPSVIARYGNEGGDYLSMPWKMLQDHVVQKTLTHVTVKDPPAVHHLNMLLVGVREVKDLVMQTVHLHSPEFAKYLRMPSSKSVLGTIEMHVNMVYQEELLNKDFPYWAGPFQALHLVPFQMDEMVSFEIVAKPPKEFSTTPRNEVRSGC